MDKVGPDAEGEIQATSEGDADAAAADDDDEEGEGEKEEEETADVADDEPDGVGGEGAAADAACWHAWTRGSNGRPAKMPDKTYTPCGEIRSGKLPLELCLNFC